MRKNPVLLFLLFSVLFLMMEGSCFYNQNTHNGEYRVIRLHYENSGGEKGVTTFDYNEKRQLSYAIWELLDGSRTSLNFYTQNPSGKLIKKYREFSDEKTSTQLFEYDENENLIRETFERSDGVHGVTSYEYDEDGKLLKANCEGLNSWFYGIISYSYNQKGKLSKGIIEQNGQKSGIINYLYDENENLVEEDWDFSGKWQQIFRYDYKKYYTDNLQLYTSANVFIPKSKKFRIIKENYAYAGETTGPSYYHYDAGGKLTEKIYERSDGLYTKTIYLYDNIGRITKAYRQYSDGKTAVFTFTFNENDKLIKKDFFRSDGLKGSENYQYDQDNFLIGAKYENVDFWLSGQIDFIHDQSGKVEKGFFAGDKGFDADITFNYDEQENLINIEWEFSFGKSQVYTYEYEKVGS
jgi:hypothetical protein